VTAEEATIPTVATETDDAPVRSRRHARAGTTERRRLLRDLAAAGAAAPTAVAVLSVALAAPILIRLSATGAQSDISVHASMAVEMVESGRWLSYSLWYPLLYLASGGSSDPVHLRAVSVLLLLVAVALKALVAYYVAWRWSRRQIVAVATSALVVVAMPLVNPARSHDIYLGQVTANVWHNSTQILALPLGICAFVAGCALLRQPSLQRALLLAVTASLSTMAKPNYTLALIPVLFVLLFWRTLRDGTMPWARRVVLALVAFVPPVALLGMQYVLTFGDEGLRKTSLVLSPMTVWDAYSASPLVSIVLSLAGPAVALVALPREYRRTPEMALSWFCLLLAVLQLALMAERFEDGTLSLEGNFFWGSYSAVAMVFLTSAIALGRAWHRPSVGRVRQWFLYLAFVLLALHVASGLYYMGRAGVAGFPVFSYQT
jgi:hypothetical protein